MLLDRPALFAIPDADEVVDLIEGAAELLGAGDERQSSKVVVVVQAVLSGGSVDGSTNPMLS